MVGVGPQISVTELQTLFCDTPENLFTVNDFNPMVLAINKLVEPAGELYIDMLLGH